MKPGAGNDGNRCSAQPAKKPHRLPRLKGRTSLRCRWDHQTDTASIDAPPKSLQVGATVAQRGFVVFCKKKGALVPWEKQGLLQAIQSPRCLDFFPRNQGMVIDQRNKPLRANTKVEGRMADAAMLTRTPPMAIGSWASTGGAPTCAPVLVNG